MLQPVGQVSGMTKHETFYQAALVFEKAIDAAATAGHSVDEILAAGVAAPPDEAQLRKALDARSSLERGPDD